MSKVLKDSVLDWSMTWFGGTIDWSDCASTDPSEWSYEDLEIFYSAGHCHHLATALHRAYGYRIGVLYETDDDYVEQPGMHLPHHVFAVDEDGRVLDIRGRRKVTDVFDDYAGTVGLSKPKFVFYANEAKFTDRVLKRGDQCLKMMSEEDVARAALLLPSRLRSLGDEYAASNEAAMSRSTSL